MRENPNTAQTGIPRRRPAYKALILSWQASLRESTLTGLCCANFMVKNHVRIELLDCEVWKKYKDDRGIAWL